MSTSTFAVSQQRWVLNPGALQPLIRSYLDHLVSRGYRAGTIHHEVANLDALTWGRTTHVTCPPASSYTEAQMPLFVFALLALVSDWPQFLGPTRNGVSPETVGWPPVVVWREDAGEGFAAPVVANGKVIFFYRANGKEVIDCLDASSGEKVWSFDYPTTYRDDFGFDEGPRLRGWWR
jgi:outer membrane protein assembly factor BamB